MWDRIPSRHLQFVSVLTGATERVQLCPRVVTITLLRIGKGYCLDVSAFCFFEFKLVARTPCVLADSDCPASLLNRHVRSKNSAQGQWFLEFLAVDPLSGLRIYVDPSSKIKQINRTHHMMIRFLF